MNPYRNVLKEIRESQNLLTKVSALLKISASTEQMAKAREVLKDKSYRDPDSGNDISFSTAYSRGIPEAKKDYAKALKSVSSDKEEEDDDDNPLDDLNEEQIDLLERVSKGKDVSNMSLVEERVLRESLAILLESQNELKDEGEPEPPKKTPPKKKRKYVKKVKSKVEKKIKKEIQPQDDDDLEFIDIDELIDLDELSEMHSDDAKPLDSALKKKERDRRDFIQQELLKEDEQAEKNRDSILNTLTQSIDSISTKANQDLEDQIKDLKEQLKESGLSESKKQDIQDSIEDLEDQRDILALNIKNTQEGYRKALSEAVKDIPDFDAEQSKQLSEAYSSMGADLISKVEDPSELNTYIEDQISELESISKDDPDYPKSLGKLLALKAMKEEVVENPTFGFSPPRLNADPVFLEEYKREVGAQQRKKFNSFSKEQRDLAAKKLSAQKEDLIDILESDSSTDAEKKEAERQMMIVRESESALNATRLLNDEEPLDGFSPVDKDILELARKNEGVVELLSNISRSDLSNEEMRQVVENNLRELPEDQWAKVLGVGSGNYKGYEDTFNSNYCPTTPANEAAGVAGQTLDDMSKCPNPVSDSLKNSLRDSLTKNFLDVQTSFQALKSKKKKRPSRKNKELAKMLKENKDEFFSILLESKHKDGSRVTEEEKEEYRNFFFTQLRALNLKSLKSQGYPINGIEDIMRKMNRIRELEGKQKLEEIEALKKLMSDMMDLNPPNKKASIFNNPFIEGRNSCGGVSMHKKSTVYIDYQERAKAFKKGMRVYTFWEGNSSQPGVVVAVFPAIGMVDVQYPTGIKRLPVEEIVDEQLKVLDQDNARPKTTPVTTKLAERIASRHVKKAIYWVERGRRYRLCKGEDPKKPNCPRCKTQMDRSVYKRRDGVSEKLFACRSCLFIIKTTDVEGV